MSFINSTVIEALEKALKSAKEHGAQHAAISLLFPGGPASIGYGGEASYGVAQQDALKQLLAKVEASVANFDYPPQDEVLGTDHVVYNVSTRPLGYDFLVWIIDAEMRRVRNGAPKPLKVGFWLGKDPTLGETDQRRMWLENLFRPGLKLIGAAESPVACSGHRSEVYTTKHIVAASRRGEAVPKLVAPNVEFSEPPVTITLREASHWPHRNSDIIDWLKFGMELKRKGRQVIVVRDTEKAFEPLAGFDCAPEASLDVIARAALYQAAACNLFVSNGPATLAVFGDRPWLQFIPIEAENSSYRPGTAAFWREEQGIEPGEQYPWSTRQQRIVWDTATYETLCEAWEMTHG